jgi:hypothetical protein
MIAMSKSQAQARARAEAAKHFAPNTKATYYVRFRATGLDLFDQAATAGATAPQLRPRVEKPSDQELHELPTLFRTIERRLREARR